MKITRTEQFQIQKYNTEQLCQQKRLEENYRKVVEQRNFEQLIADRVARNIEMDSTKGRNIDLEC
jgi:hypothetical protein